MGKTKRARDSRVMAVADRLVVRSIMQTTLWASSIWSASSCSSSPSFWSSSCLLAICLAIAGGFSFPRSLWAQAVFENPPPGSFQSGLGVISGWACEAERIDIVFNAGTDAEVTAQAAYGTDRADTRPSCSDSDNGFGLLFNWNLLGDGTHTVHARADGEIFGSAAVTVTTLGREFLTGVEKRARLKDFPDTGTDLVVAWQPAIQNFVILGAAPVEPPQYAAPVRVTGPLGRNEDGEQFAPDAAIPGDLNGDGHEDLVFQLWAGDLAAPKAASPVVMLLNDGAGNLVDETATLIAGPLPQVFAVRQFIIEDFNGDGQNDIFMSNHGREDKPEHFDGEQNRLLLSGPDGRLRDMSAQNLPQVADFSHGSSVADVDGDGDMDVWVNNLGGGEAPSYLMLNDGSGSFRIVADIGYPVPDFRGRERIVGTNGRLPEILIGSYPFWTHFIDAENDGDADLYLGLIENVENVDGSQSDRTGILLNDGTGRFTLSGAEAIPPPLIGGTGQAQDSIRADLNQDGLHDLLLYQSDSMFGGHFVQVLISNGDGSFRDETSLRLPAQVNAFQGGGAPIFWFRDMNGDGHNEILNFLYGPDFQPATDVIDSYLNMGNGVFTSLPDDFVNVRPIVAAVDVNGDGWVDFLDAQYDFNPFGEAELFLTTALNPNTSP